MKFDSSVIDARAQTLAKVAATLKSEFYGLDIIIDRVISSINAWYTFPDLISRPVIVNLWGLTGVGKTHLVRRLAELLEFRDRFVEVQMDGISSSSSHQAKTIASLLIESSIEQGAPGILLLDEFQRYRTVDERGEEAPVERFQDVWMLLSDGKFSADASIFQELEMMIAYSEYHRDDNEEEETVKKINKKKEAAATKKKFHIYPYEARRIKRMLNLTVSVSVQDIMQWSVQQLNDEITKAMKNSVGSQLDYTKTLIFVSGNLDEAFAPEDTIDDCDTDADVFHEMTKKISVMDIKHALGKRFKPEQISRFGNNHIIYPSISKNAYQKIIHFACTQYIDSISQITGIEFALTKESESVIYANAVYPTQGTRPVFSSVHSIFSDGLVQVAFWAIKNKVSKLTMNIDAARSILRAVPLCTNTHFDEFIEIPIILDIAAQRKKATPDFVLTVTVHEAGHALVYALLKREAPREVKVNTASFKGGYMLPNDNEYKGLSKQDMRDNIAVLYGGRAAELMVFGPNNVTIGAGNDILNATKVASSYVRSYALDGVVGAEIEPAQGIVPEGILPSETSSDTIINLLEEEQKRAQNLLLINKELLVRIVDALLINNTFNQQEFIKLLPELNLVDSTSNRQTLYSSFKGEKHVN